MSKTALNFLEEAGIPKPLQSRSQASLERMMRAARELMEERGSGEFSLAEVCERGKVSNGSVFSRIKSKEELLVALQLQILDEVQASEDRSLVKIRAATDLSNTIDAIVELVAQTLAKHAQSLRPLMRMAADHPQIADLGAKSYLKNERSVLEQLLRFRKEIAPANPQEVCTYAYRIFYAAVARHLGFGNFEGTLSAGEWKSLKLHLAAMMKAYLVKRDR